MGELVTADVVVAAKRDARDEVVAKLLTAGLDPHTVSSMLDISITEVKSLTRTTTHLLREDQELVDAIRSLMWKATHEATLTLEFGPPEAKHQLVRTLIGNAAKLVGKETSEDTETSKAAFEQLFADMRDIPESNAS